MSSEAASAAPAANVDGSTETKPKSAAKIRKRAPKACLSCRARKVRCDVSQRGRPCMNCYLDNESCVVTGRASRFRRQRDGADVQASYPPYTSDHAVGKTAEDVVRSRDNGEPASPGDKCTHSQSHDDGRPAEPSDAQGQPVHASTPHSEHHQPSISSASDAISSTSSVRAPLPMPAFKEPMAIPLKTMAGSAGQFPATGGLSFGAGEQRVAANADITYSYYPFVCINNLHIIMPQDVNYLEAQGCLRVPTRRILDEFVQQYFLHVHPVLPLINEGDFWEMYCHQGTSGPSQRIPLLVLTAMMFASCNFISQSSAKALGFSSVREARATIYRRTKLLYDFETESSLIYMAQAAVLLSLFSPNLAGATRKPNSGWLSIAIQNAKSAEAHLQSTLPMYSPILQPVEYKRQNTLKRLWWCCIIRDRILPLGLRRSIQITRAHFDLDANSGLGYADLADEIDRSKVYNPEAKRNLIELLVCVMELCSVLTDVLALVFPMDDVPGWGRQSSGEAAKIRECKSALRRWYKGATMRFPMFGGGTAPRLTPGSGREFQHESVILYANLMYMYYHSARVALCHHEVLQTAVASATPNLNTNLREFSNIYENRHELQDAASGVTECLKELVQLGLARWLPISAVACTALPLALHIIDVRLSAINSARGQAEDQNSQSAVKQHRLNILIEAMKTYQPQYDGIDSVSEAIRHIVNLAQLDSTPSGGAVLAIESGQPISDWTDILATQPGLYLRLALTMDLALSKGRIPEESDFPASLRGLYCRGLNGLNANGHRSAAATATAAAATAQSTTSSAGINAALPSRTAQQPFFTPASSLNMAPGTVRSIPSDEEAGSPSSAKNMYQNQNQNHQQQQQQQQPVVPAMFSAPTNQLPAADLTGMGDSTNNNNITLSITTPDLSLFDDVLNIDNLAGEVLTAYNLNADDGTPPSNPGSASSSPGDGDEDLDLDMDMDMYDSDDLSLKEGDWIGQAWTDDYQHHSHIIEKPVVVAGGGGSGDSHGGVGPPAAAAAAAGVAMMGAAEGIVGPDRAPAAMVLLDAIRDDGVSCH